jgi:nitrate/TMAO reductase-like tetraheme cytochrome c subunit
MKFRELVTNATSFLTGLPTGVKVVAGVALLALLAVGSVLMYRTYEFVQHDNQFCLECHLMEDPYEQFARSEHRGLGCKACHRPNIVQRSEMGLAQIVENPDSIRVHAHVPNSVCAECHIEGDPDQWRRVANTAGHRIHLESEDPALEGLNCVECHSSGVHHFTPTDQTCGQGGCHEDTRIRLGEMAEITIHCATCHDFATPVSPEATTAAVATSLNPQAEECLSCHQMRALLTDLPDDEPHDAQCGVCHNPHQQLTPAEAVQSCATGGCHSQPDTLTAHHRGLDPGVLDDCTLCHEAHTFRIHEDGQDCLSCHEDIYQDAPSRRIGAASSGPVRVASAGPIEPALARLALAAHPRPQADTVRFWHSQHEDVECTACHTMRGEHGALTVTSIADCRSCHHAAPVATDCTRCHARPEMLAQTYELERVFDLSAGEGRRVSRTLPFRHEVHTDLGCGTCHTEGLGLGGGNVDCKACHEEHHEPNTDCKTCHVQPPVDAHDIDSHLGCAGAGCHEAAPESVRSVPRTRDFCLVCHQDMTSHRPGRSCEQCHILPRPQTAAGPGTQGPQLAEEP